MNDLSHKMVIVVASTVMGKEIKPSVVLIILWLNTQQCLLLPCALSPRPWGRKTVTPVPLNCSRGLPLPHLSVLFPIPRGCLLWHCSAIHLQAISPCRRSNLGGRQSLPGAGGGTRSQPLALRIQELADRCLFVTSEAGSHS